MLMIPKAASLAPIVTMHDDVPPTLAPSVETSKTTMNVSSSSGKSSLTSGTSNVTLLSPSAKTIVPLMCTISDLSAEPKSTCHETATTPVTPCSLMIVRDAAADSSLASALLESKIKRPRALSFSAMATAVALVSSEIRNCDRETVCGIGSPAAIDACLPSFTAHIRSAKVLHAASAAGS